MRLVSAALPLLLSLSGAEEARGFVAYPPVRSVQRRHSHLPPPGWSLLPVRGGRSKILANSRSSLPEPLSKADRKRRRPGSQKQRQKISKRGNLENTREKSIAKGRDPIISLNMNLDYLGKSGQRGAAGRAEELLLRIEALHAEGYYEIKPDTCSYNSVINAFAIEAATEKMSGVGNNAAMEAQRLLGMMTDIDSKPANGDIVRPNVISFNTVILALANSGQPQKAEDLLHEMEDICLVERGADRDCMPNTITYNSCILAWAKAGEPHRAEELLRRMMKMSVERADPDELKADVIAFNTILHAWAVSGRRGAAERAEDLLRHMEHLYLSGNEDVQPDTVSYTSVISAWASSKNQDAAKRALALLEEMEQLYEDGEDGVKPNAYSYTATINALARGKSSGSAQKAHLILTKMQQRYAAGEDDCKPDVVCYTSVINAYSKSGDSDAVENAVALLNFMIDECEAGDISLRPNARTYCAVITTLGRSGEYGAAEAAERLLEDMERMYAFGNRSVKPTTAVFNAVIDAYARSSYKKKAARAHQILLRMLEEASEGNGDIYPDVVSYNSVIKSCANSFGGVERKKKAFLIALDTFKRLHRSDSGRDRCTSVTYTLFFKAIRRLIIAGEERNKILGKTFEFCIAEGLLNRQVLSQVQSACNEKVFTNILASYGVHRLPQNDNSSLHIKVEDLPQDWSRKSRY